MVRNRYYKGLFLIGAIWNWIISSVFFFAHKSVISHLGMEPLRYSLPLQLAMVLVFVYGIAYFYVYQDPVRNRNCTKLGIYSKLLVFFVLLYNWLIGEVVFMLVLPGIIDLIFAVLYLEFLLRFKPEAD